MNGFMTLWDNPEWPVQWGAVIGASLFAAICDCRSRRIPNMLSGPFILLGLIFSTAVAGWAGLADSLAGAAIAGLPFVLMFVFGGGGAGDAKMMMGIGAWLGVVGATLDLVCVVWVGGLIGLLYALACGRLRSVLTHVGYFCSALCAVGLSGQRGIESYQNVLPRTEQMQTMPYGPAIFLGTFFAAIGAFLWHAS